MTSRYEAGYRDGGNNVEADWDFALSENLGVEGYVGFYQFTQFLSGLLSPQQLEALRNEFRNDDPKEG